ncbi:MAG: pyrroline-5-carboxylate reductase [Armatimonadota bacterium]
MLNGKSIGFIGGGMMAEAIAQGLSRAGVERITVSDPDERRRAVFPSATDSNLAVAKDADILILAVKPHIIPHVLAEIESALDPAQLIISIAAGVTADFIQTSLQVNVPVVRAMPNTPCLIGEGATAIAPGKFAEPEHMDLAEQIFAAVGKVVRVDEEKMDAVTGLSGSGPAFVYMFIEALADGGVRMGLPRDTALLLAAQTVTGAARMVTETGEHPVTLRDRVTTPGGTTIAGIASLESSGFRSSAIEAVSSAARRSSELGNK